MSADKKIENVSGSDNKDKQEWREPEYSKLKAEETATGFGGFDEDADIKTGS